MKHINKYKSMQKNFKIKMSHQIYKKWDLKII